VFSESSISTVVPIRRPDKWGVYVTWPEEGLHNVHPDDLWLAERLLPGNRVFLRQDLDSEFNLLSYGRHQLRVRPTMWVETPEPPFKLGDQVEVRSQLGRLTPQIARVAQVFWNSRNRRMEFELSRLGRPVPGRFLASDLSPVGKSAGYLSLLGGLLS
jgi:hypothetical protein